MSLKAFFLFVAAAAIAFAITARDGGQQATTLRDSVGPPVETTRL